MFDHEQWKLLEHIIHLNGDKFVGKTRFQKTVYLLQAKGQELGYKFEYHHYGPYSEEISEHLAFSEHLGHLDTREEPGYNSVPYTIFDLKRPPVIDDDKNRDQSIREALSALHKCATVVLELAATLHFLRHDGYENEAENELRLRKSTKASVDRVLKANKLLADLDIQ